MKIATFLVAVLLASPVLGAGQKSIMRKMWLTSQACFVRPEDSGRMNSLHSIISFSNGQKVTLEGGEAACLYLLPGNYSFRIEFPNSQGLFSRKSVSPKYSVRLGEGARVVFAIYPTRTKAEEYAGGWLARRVGQNTRKK